jgi:hypothetical protein
MFKWFLFKMNIIKKKLNYVKKLIIH